MGIESEYGIAAIGAPEFDPMALSNAVVRAWQDRAGDRWDYSTETPLQDSRGFEVSRARAHPSQLTDDQTMANTVLSNGARFYVDHAHPEYSGPECTSATDAVRFDTAGDVIAYRAAVRAGESLGLPIRLWKNNTDGKGAAYGTHENYLTPRPVGFHQYVRHFTTHLVTRQIFTGNGRVGLGQDSEEPGYQLSQRADFFEAEVGLETTIRRPIINTRDEPHADARRHRRLHVITGDANRSEYATWLKLGTAQLVLAAIGDGAFEATDDRLQLAEPVAAMHQISHDPSLQVQVELAGGRTASALELQRELWEVCSSWLDGAAGLTDADRVEYQQIRTAWASILTDLAADPMSCADRLDWVAKLALLERYRSRDQLAWDHPKLALVDLQYAEIDPQRSLYQALVRSGRMRRLTTDAEVEDAMEAPPVDTRAWFRGECVRRYGAQVIAASWDSVVFDVPGGRSYVRVPMDDPLRGTRASVAELLDRSPDVRSLLAGLEAIP